VHGFVFQGESKAGGCYLNSLGQLEAVALYSHFDSHFSKAVFGMVAMLHGQPRTAPKFLWFFNAFLSTLSLIFTSNRIELAHIHH
jgi:hypothetical protein